MNNNIKDIKNGFYGEFIKENDDGTFTVKDYVLYKKLKIEDDIVWWFNEKTKYPGKWIPSIPIISIKNQRHEQLYFKNETEIIDIDSIFDSPDYFSVAKGRTAEIIYMTPMEYMELCTKRFWKSTLEEEIASTFKLRVKKYANDILKGDLFPLISIEYHEDNSIDQEGKHRAMAIQYLIDNNKIPEDTQIPVVIVEET